MVPYSKLSKKNNNKNFDMTVWDSMNIFYKMYKRNYVQDKIALTKIQVI